MKRVLVNIVVHTGHIPDLETLLSREAATAGKWKEEGILEHLYTKSDRSGVYLLFKQVEEAEVRKLIPTLPLFKYFEAVGYEALEQQF